MDNLFLMIFSLVNGRFFRKLYYKIRSSTKKHKLYLRELFFYL